MKWVKIYLLVFVLFLSCSTAYSDVVFTDIYNLFNQAEMQLNSIEFELNNMRETINKQSIVIDDLKKSLLMKESLLIEQSNTIQNLETVYKEQVEVSRNLEQSLKKSESTAKRWKCCSIVLAAIATAIAVIK